MILPHPYFFKISVTGIGFYSHMSNEQFLPVTGTIVTAGSYEKGLRLTGLARPPYEPELIVYFTKDIGVRNISNTKDRV